MMTGVVRGGLGIIRIATPIKASKKETELALDIFEGAISKSLS